MPIDYKKYPKNWKEIRERILERAENKCECCGLQNAIKVISYKIKNKTFWVTIEKWFNNQLKMIPYKEVKVVLTIAHLDHDETNHDVKDKRLMALCQLCHLRYDAKEKQKRRLFKINKQ